jgi:hypothetical protein
MVAFLFLACTTASGAIILYHEFITAIVRRHRRFACVHDHLATTALEATYAMPDMSKGTKKTDWLVVICVLKEVELLYDCVLHALIAGEGLGTVVVALDGRTTEIVGECHRIVEMANTQYQSTQGSNVHTRAICVPTFLGWDPEIYRQSKAVALNIIASLRGTDIYWNTKRISHPLTLRPPATPSADWQVISIPAAMFAVCVDVDEILMKEGLESLVAATRRHPEAILVQCAKHDQPVCRNPFSRGFTAAYTSWFFQGAAWSNAGNGHLSASYYGSMAALKIDDDAYPSCTYTLTNGEKVQGIEVFPTQYAVEDYPLYIKHLRDRTTVFLPRIAGHGLAPVDAGALLQLWGRWAFGNLATIRDLPQAALGWRTSTNQKRCMQVHAISWITVGLVGILPIFSSFSLLIDSNFTIPVCLVTAITILAVTYRQLLPVRGISLADRILRMPTEAILWPVSIICIAIVIAGARPGLTSAATPRFRGRIPVYFWLIYLSESILIMCSLTSMLGSNTNLWVILLYIQGALPFMIGVMFLVGDTLTTVPRREKRLFLLPYNGLLVTCARDSTSSRVERSISGDDARPLTFISSDQ